MLRLTCRVNFPCPTSLASRHMRPMAPQPTRNRGSACEESLSSFERGFQRRGDGGRRGWLGGVGRWYGVYATKSREVRFNVGWACDARNPQPRRCWRGSSARYPQLCSHKADVARGRGGRGRTTLSAPAVATRCLLYPNWFKSRTGKQSFSLTNGSNSNNLPDKKATSVLNFIHFRYPAIYFIFSRVGRDPEESSCPGGKVWAWIPRVDHPAVETPRHLDLLLPNPPALWAAEGRGVCFRLRAKMGLPTVAGPGEGGEVGDDEKPLPEVSRPSPMLRDSPVRSLGLRPSPTSRCADLRSLVTPLAAGLDKELVQHLEEELLLQWQDGQADLGPPEQRRRCAASPAYPPSKKSLPSIRHHGAEDLSRLLYHQTCVLIVH